MTSVPNYEKQPLNVSMMGGPLKGRHLAGGCDPGNSALLNGTNLNALQILCVGAAFGRRKKKGREGGCVFLGMLVVEGGGGGGSGHT